jgi:phage gp29-like protein
MEYLMPNPTRIEVNCTTGEVLEIELTDAEVAELAYQAELAADKKAEDDRIAAERATAKAALLERLGITADEAALLLA